MPCLSVRPASVGLIRRLIPGVVAAALVLSAVLQLPATAKAAGCQFTLGFAILHNLIPSIVGDGVTDEHHGANGDALQSTTRGSLVWRKAGKHPTVNEFESAENAELALAETDLRALLRATFNADRNECGLWRRSGPCGIMEPGDRTD
ncbi:MAG TPA: hypothetical protein VNL16_06035 [Chloroflexota bacterium]|nr:hypothetical protein [Chloroflexota bacterium]